MAGQPNPHSAAQRLRARIEREGERYWTHDDFRELPATAVAATLSRLARAGVLKRVRKGVYYQSRPTAFGQSVPTMWAVLEETFHAPLHPSGLTAASVLGLTQQHPAVAEFATISATIPQALGNARVRTRRPAARARLTDEEGALLELLRDRAAASDLEPERTQQHVLKFLGRRGAFARLARASLSEPPRVRALLGALGEEMGADASLLRRLKRTLNPLSRYDFGAFRTLPSATRWYAA